MSFHPALRPWKSHFLPGAQVFQPQKRRLENRVGPLQPFPGCPARPPSSSSTDSNASLGPDPLPPPTHQTQAPGHRRANPLSRRDGQCPEPLAGSSQEATKERENRRWNDVNPFDNDHFVSTSKASGTVLSPPKRRAPEPHAGPGGSLLSRPQCAYEGAEARRSELTDPRSPSRDEAVSAVPTHAPGSGWRARGAPCREAAGRAAGRAEPPAHPPRRIVSPAPPPLSAAATHRISGGSDRPSSPGCRCPPRPRCGDSGWSPWCTAGRAEYGMGSAAAPEASSRGHSRDQAARTLAHGRGRSASKPPPPARPGTRRHGSPPPPGPEAPREMESPRRRGCPAAARDTHLGTTFPRKLLARAR